MTSSLTSFSFILIDSRNHTITLPQALVARRSWFIADMPYVIDQYPMMYRTHVLVARRIQS